MRMKRGIRTGAAAVALGMLLTVPVFAADFSVNLGSVNTPCHAAQLKVTISGSDSVAFESDAPGAAVHVSNDGDKTTATLYVASEKSLVQGTTLSLGTLDLESGATVDFEKNDLTLLSPSLEALAQTEIEKVDVEIREKSGGSSSGSSSSGSGSANKTPTVSVDGIGGKVSADKNGKVTITPDEGYRIAEILVNGKAVDISSELTGLTSRDKVVVTFEKIEDSGVSIPFADVAEGEYYYDAVAWAVENDITNGTSETTFSPGLSCTRAQMVTFLWRAVGSPEPAAAANPFTDVQADAYYYDAVLWAVEQGITNGTSAITFDPDQTVDRSQTVTFLWRSEGSPVVNYLMTFDDVLPDTYYTEAVRWAVSEGVTTGTGAATFSPDDDCTRGQIVTFLYRTII